MFRTSILFFISGLALFLTGCETASSNQYLARETEYGSVSDSVTVHFNCREETKSYRGDSGSEIDMFAKCMERHGYAPDGKSLEKPASTSSSTEQRLQELNDLKTNGLITEAEYNKKKAEILKDL